MPDIREFDALQWLNGHFRGELSLSLEQLGPILCFSLIWNLFETRACGRHATQESIRRAVDHADESGRLEHSRYEPFLTFFQNRYQGRSSDETFRRLLMENQTAQEMVRRALLGEAQDLNNKVYALLLIGHRVRNNLFHGNKEVGSLPRQTELFVAVNALLATFLEDIENFPQRSG